MKYMLNWKSSIIPHTSDSLYFPIRFSDFPNSSRTRRDDFRPPDECPLLFLITILDESPILWSVCQAQVRILETEQLFIIVSKGTIKSLHLLIWTRSRLLANLRKASYGWDKQGSPDMVVDFLLERIVKKCIHLFVVLCVFWWRSRTWFSSIEIYWF